VFAQVALRHGIEVTPGTAMDPSGTHDSYIRVPFTFPDGTLTKLAQRLQAAWDDLQRHARPDPLPNGGFLITAERLSRRPGGGE
jgi:hypothetical protein